MSTTPSHHLRDLLEDLPGVRRVGSGKVRELYTVDEHLLLVATDRVSAFDVVLPTPVPDKGRVLTALSAFWFSHLADVVDTHLVSADVDEFPAALRPAADLLRGRALLCRRAEVLPLECVARGYLAGSGWREYAAQGTVCGLSLPAGLEESSRLPEPVFTPSTKAAEGHDENITFAAAEALVGADVAQELRRLTLRLYDVASAHAAARGIVIADTKLEFGFVGSRLLLVDEAFTPDSSRFWPADRYAPGRSQPSYDKQIVRDWLEQSGWDKSPPAPDLPPDVVARARARYVEVYERLTGQTFAAWPGGGS